ncbi:helix-turn-helix transcriptional regulator [uncultured Microbacterium sp.]|uniref:helix-turn-helix domain-containing protein n=1 Tax=uncultured Microbacterium sp. TaxID=191216 RepID=UPI0025D8CB98|nr:helix-turn-helix transcriptional regulator [uncultured Microbacterium sp.]
MNTRERGELFSRYIGLELKGAIVARALTAKAVAEQIGRADANLNRWLNGKTEIPIGVVCEVCEVLDLEPRTIVEHAYDRMIDELGERTIPENVTPLRGRDVEPSRQDDRKVAKKKSRDRGGDDGQG